MKTFIRYHGTSWENVEKIRENGIQISDNGTLGPGFYCGPFSTAADYAKKCAARDKGTIPFVLVLRVSWITRTRVGDPDEAKTANGFDIVEWKDETCVRDASAITLISYFSYAAYCAEKLRHVIAGTEKEEEVFEATQDIPRKCTELYLQSVREFLELGWGHVWAVNASKIHFYAKLPRSCLVSEKLAPNKPEDHFCRETGECFLVGTHRHIHCAVCNEPPPFVEQVRCRKEDLDNVHPDLYVHFFREETYISLCVECLRLSKNVAKEAVLCISLLEPSAKKQAEEELGNYPIFQRYRKAENYPEQFDKILRPCYVKNQVYIPNLNYYITYEVNEQFTDEMRNYRNHFFPGGFDPKHVNLD